MLCPHGADILTCEKCFETVKRFRQAQETGNTAEMERISREMKTEYAMLQQQRQRCLHCGHEWLPRSAQRPGVCPRCKSYNWDKEPQKKKEKKEQAMTTYARDDRGPQSIYIGARSDGWYRVDDDVEGEFLTGTIVDVPDDRTFVVRSVASGRLWRCRHLGDGIVVEAEPLPTAIPRRKRFVALTTTNPQMGWRALAIGPDPSTVRAEAEARICGNDLYAQTERRNLVVVSRTTALRQYGKSEDSIYDDLESLDCPLGS